MDFYNAVNTIRQRHVSIMYISQKNEKSRYKFLKVFWADERQIWPQAYAYGLFGCFYGCRRSERLSDAGVASDILGITGYIFGAIVPPLTGLNGVLHAAAIVIFVLGVTQSTSGVSDSAVSDKSQKK